LRFSIPMSRWCLKGLRNMWWDVGAQDGPLHEWWTPFRTCDETSQLKRSKALKCEEKLLENKIEIIYRFNVSRIFRSHGENIYVLYNEKAFHKTLEIKCTIKLRFVHVMTFVHINNWCFFSILQLQICLELKLPLFDHDANFTMNKKIITNFVKQSKDL
jgi:hypothetical protein